MGCFSWLDCQKNTKRSGIRIGEKAYLLVPEDFGGGHIEEDCYDGYGRFGGQDVYELVALWNRKNIDESNLYNEAPRLENYAGLWDFEKKELKEAGATEEEIAEKDNAARKKHYNNEVARYKQSIQRLKDFSEEVDEGVMRNRYGDDYLRLIGISIACYDEQNAKLKYPIKITRDENAVYEDCKPSKGDPYQGCF